MSDLIPSPVLLAILQHKINNVTDEQVVSAVNKYLTDNPVQAYDDSEIKSEIGVLKGDLSDKLPKSPDDWEPWTSDEQAVARERMGFHNAFELLVSQELTETVVNISFELGKTVNEIYMICESPKIIALSPCSWMNENGKPIGYWPSSVLSVNSTRYVMTHFYTIDNVMTVCDTCYGTNNLAISNINTSCYNEINDGISKLIGTYANGLVAGTKFTIWGR